MSEAREWMERLQMPPIPIELAFLDRRCYDTQEGKRRWAATPDANFILSCQIVMRLPGTPLSRES